jgi:hypothetical protein
MKKWRPLMVARVIGTDAEAGSDLREDIDGKKSPCLQHRSRRHRWGSEEVLGSMRQGHKVLRLEQASE